MAKQDSPLVRFYRMIEEARLPQRADRSAGGTLPVRAFRYCEAVTAAAGFGWWVFPPADLELLWDGHDILWRCTGWQDWLPLADAAQFPGFAARFDDAAPEILRGCSPPLLTAMPEPGTVQIWSGLIARTASDWSLLIRAPANIPMPGGYAMYEGLVEADRWFGPLFTNIRCARTDRTIRLRADFPLALVQPVPRVAYADRTLSAIDLVADMAGLSSADWASYQSTIVEPNANPNRRFGAYAGAARKREANGCSIVATIG